ncbi:MAG: hypothetical protein ACHQT7_00465 [Candidatus Levyibacteriota bacterium]
MLKRLPIILLSAVLFIIFFSQLAHAQTPATPSPTQKLLKISSTSTLQIAGPNVTPTPGDWVSDPNVTFVGKTASRSGDFLDLTLRTYDWACVKKNAQNVCDNAGNPLVTFWATIRNIVYALLLSVVLISSFVMIITRGKNLTVTRFIPRFILIIVLVTLSYALIQFIYQLTDIVQGFFLRFNGNLITTHDLIYIGFPYDTFTGLRRFGEAYDESAFITLLLVRLTAITYYVMSGVLIVRKIILWFFIILSPVFPLLLFFRPIRNTGKIWVGEFFRWLLYAPLFAIFLNGVVVMWKNGINGIPLAFDFSKVGSVIYPTAVNILIGGPGQTIFYLSDTNSNSVNLQDTFALYVVSLLMLWVVIILPFILLKIFLDAVNGISISDNPSLKKLWDRIPSRTPAPVAPPPSTAPQGAGRAMQMPFGAGQTRTISNATQSRLNTQFIPSIIAIPANTQILQLANLSIPKMRDIARFETSMVSNNTSKMQDVSRLKTSLTRISNPTTVSSPTERERYTEVRHQLISEKQKGNVLATTILNAANTATQVTSQKAPGQKANTLSPSAAHLPVVNKVQQVSIEDYEEVRKMWVDTYQNATPPTDLSGQKGSREEWVKEDIDEINKAITFLNSVDPARINEGMEMVSNILPFLMIGGFSKTEVIAYLKAKLEAAKSVLSETGTTDGEDTMLENKKSDTSLEQHLSAETEAEMPTEDAGKAKIEDMRKGGNV